LVATEEAPEDGLEGGLTSGMMREIDSTILTLSAKHKLDIEESDDRFHIPETDVSRFLPIFLNESCGWVLYQ